VTRFAGVSRGAGGIFSACLSCGARCQRGESYCPKHRPVRRSAKLRGGGAQIAKFRAECFRIAGGQCEAILNGERCSERDPKQLEAHHVQRVTESGPNDAATNGLLLCKTHHALLESRKLSA
jgi:hypothetical protein